MYYLQSRYYDSQVGRLINADDVNIMDAMQKGLKGSNLFEYCKNNSVNKKDPNGKWSLSLKYAPYIVDAIIITIESLATVNKLMRQARTYKGLLKSMKAVFKKGLWRIKKCLGRIIRRIIKTRSKALLIERIVMKSLNCIFGWLIVFSSIGDVISYLIDCCDGKRDKRFNFSRLKFRLCRP